MRFGADLYRIKQKRGVPAYQYKKFTKIALYFLKIGFFIVVVIAFMPFNELRNDLFQLWWYTLIAMGAVYVGMLFYWQRVDTERRNGYCTVFERQELSGAARLSLIYIDGPSSILLARADQDINAEGDLERLRSEMNETLAQGASVHTVDLPKYRVPIWEWESIWAGAIQPLYETNLRKDTSCDAVKFLKAFTIAGRPINFD